MAATLYYTLLSISDVTATQEATGYDAINVADPRIAKPWRSTSTATNNVDIDLGSDKTIEGVMLQESNIGAVTVSTATAAAHPTFTSRGTLTVGHEDNGRRKAYLDVGGVTGRYVRIAATGTPEDGGSYWRIGAAYVWSASVTLDPPPEQDWEQEFRRPSSIRNLPNGRTVITSLGDDYSVLSFQFRERRGSEYLRDLVQQAWLATAGLVLDISGQPELAWPVIASTEDVSRAMPDSVYSDLRVEFVEVV